ncbi:phage tail tape measure protein [Prescottella equi]|uniref:phage tail tape measure protein n=1 Tax=Rhodococcus hoagii TaxID=43767 RepID=UPI0012F9F9DA|nr:phage tail tape measure protein [Prescottella equi]
MTTSIGWCSVQIVPVVPGIGREVSRQLTPQMQQAGRQAGQELGDGIADGLAKAEAAVKTASRKLAQSRNAEKDAAAKLSIEEKKLQELRDSGKAKASQIEAAELRIEQARRKHNEATGKLEASLKQLEAAQDRAKRATQEAGDEAEQSSRKLLNFSNSVDDMGDGVDNGMGKLTGLTAALAGIGGAVGLGMQALDNLDIEATLGAQLGATPELAKEYGDSAGLLYKQGLTGSMQEAADAVAAVASTFKVAGSEGERSVDEIAESALNFSKVFGTDVNESVQTAQQLITQGLAKDSAEAFDLMGAAWQRTGTGMRDELPELMNEYGGFFSSLGFSGQDAFGLIVGASDQGKIAMDKMGDALKETGIRATDLGDKAAQGALTQIGLDATATANALLAGGDTAKQAFGEMVNGLLQIQDPAKQAEAAVALFGTPLEDLGKDGIPAFLQAMSGAGDQMAGFEGTMTTIGEQVNSGPGHALEQFKNTITGGLTDALADMATWVMNNADTLQTLAMVAAPFFGALAGYAATVKIIQIATVAWNVAQMILNGTMMLNPIGLIVAAIAGLVAAVVLVATKTTWFQTIWDTVWNAIKAAWDWVWGVLQAGFNGLMDAFGAVGNKVGEVKDWIVARWNDVVGFVTGLPGRIGSAASGMWDGIKNAFKGAINWIIQAWNAIEFRIPGFEVGPIKWDGFTLGLPDLPLLATGGLAGRRKDGMLWGPGTPTSDSILGVDAYGIPTALVSTREFVVNAQATAENLPLLQAINAGWTPSAEFLHGLTRGDFRSNPFGIEEDSPLVAGALDARSLIADGDYTGNLRDAFGIEEDHPVVGSILALRKVISRLPRFAEGGAVVSPDQLVNFAKGVEGKPYVWGGVNWGDCSGAVSALANYATGRDPFGSRFATMTEGAELLARGFKPGLGPSGSLNVGWFNGGPYGGHTAATLPNNVNFEMGGGRGNGQYGGPAAGANDPMFTDHAHLPMVVAQLIQPNVQQLDPLTGFPTDSGTGAALGTALTDPSAAGVAQPQQAFSGRERIKQMGADIGGIWADAAVEMLGAGEWLDLADRYTVTPDATAGAATSTPTTGENGVDGDPNIIPWIADLNAFLKGTGLFDDGGWLMPNSFSYNALSKPEPILKPEHWDIAEANIDKVDELVGAGAPARGGNTYITNATFRDEDEYYRRQAQNQRLNSKQHLGRWPK